MIADRLLAAHTLGDMIVRYVRDPATGRVGFEAFPASASELVVEPRAVLPDYPEFAARPVESLLQFKLVGDSYPGAFAQGHTLRNSETLGRFQYEQQTVEKSGSLTTIRTVLGDPAGLKAYHVLQFKDGDTAFTLHSEFVNGSDRPVTLEMLASFSLSGMTPFDAADASGHLHVHRFRSVWSAEGRHECRSIEDLHLERSWIGAGAFSERFGQIGTMPVRKWFPFVAVEDAEAGVIWGAQLAWAGSWQMEVFRQHDDICISGGLADREFGHWMKTLAPGESIVSPPAYVSSVQGDIDTLCDRLTAMQCDAVKSQPSIERDLPVIFNEWCTTWGNPSDEHLEAIADRLEGSGVRYLVIDAGWYKGTGCDDWNNSHGDWVPNPKLFPSGLKAVADAIRQRGLIPGIWFEWETVGSDSMAFRTGRHFLHRDGVPVTVRERRFWDLNDPEALAILTTKVIDLLENCGFGYLKVDYNETLGLGCEHPDSLGEGSRLQVEGIYRFFETIRKRLPDLVIENCSSGGHRLEPSMMARSAMSSFSDAHELVEIPIIAANLHRLMLPCQSQIWAVLRPSDSAQRLRYSLSATFLGRMCLSGDIEKLPAASWSLTREAIDFYHKCASVIKYGTSRRFGAIGSSWRHPAGWQAVVRSSDSQALVVVHTFANSPECLEIPLSGNWLLEESFADCEYEISDGFLRVRPGGDFSGSVFLLRKGEMSEVSEHSQLEDRIPDSSR